MLQFVKTQALGNDFILLEREWAKNYNLQEIAPKICHRNFGIGSDGILIVDKKDGLYQMTMLNPDGSRAMCGNGLRAFARYLLDEKYITENSFQVVTDSGINQIEIEKSSSNEPLIKACLNHPIFERKAIPYAKNGKEPALEEVIELKEKTFHASVLSMGNPHAVIFVDDIKEIDVEYWGPQIEHHSLFPERSNVEFVQVIDRNNMIMRVWERGAGQTLACGTGTAASVVAGVQKGLVNTRVKVELLGGDLEIDYSPGEKVWMIGPASEVFRGEINPDSIYFKNVL